MFEQLLARTAHALDAARIPYMVIGGQAVLIYGEPRFTKVIDVTLGVTLDRLDLVLSHSAYEQQAMARARIVETGGESVRFASPEDLVIHKVVAGRPRDLEDVRAILLKNPGMDRGLIVQSLDEFERALAEPFLRRFESCEE